MRSTPTYTRVLTTEDLTLNASRIAHVMRIGKAQLEADAKTFIDEAARLELLAKVDTTCPKAFGKPCADPNCTYDSETVSMHKRGAESMRAMAREFQRYVDEASETILTIETACEYGPGQVTIVATDIHDLDEVKVQIADALEDEG